jgi:3D (Asp-Asp-Asp) domain-containing protein
LFLFRRTALWIGCAILTVAFVGAVVFIGGDGRHSGAATASEAADGLEAGNELPGSAPIINLDVDTPLILDAADVFGPFSYPGGGKATTIRGDDPKPAAKGKAKSAPIRRRHRVTAYCDRGLTAAGVMSGVGQCAAPADVPFGSRVHIPALGRTFVVTDRTARAYRHNTVDLFIASEEACRQFGRRYLACEITVPEREPAYGEVRVPAPGR